MSVNRDLVPVGLLVTVTGPSMYGGGGQLRQSLERPTRTRTKRQTYMNTDGSFWCAVLGNWCPL